MSTANAAREAISAADSATESTPSAPASSNAADYPELALQEMDHHLAADGSDSLTRRVAAAAVGFHDPRPFEITKQGMARRQFDDHGSATRRAAREAMDLAAWAEDVELDPADKRAMHLHDFARSVNESTMDETLPAGGADFHADADAIADAIIRRGRDR
jgi:hypothetical protein